MLYTLAVESTAAGITTAFATVIVALTGLVGSLLAFYKVVRPVKQEQKRQGDVADSTNALVNGHSTALQQHIQLLSQLLQENNIAVPPDKSLTPPS